MSFGFSVGDFVTISALALSIYDSYKDSSGDFKSTTSDAKPPHTAPEKTTEYLSENSLDSDGVAQLEILKMDAVDVLKDIQHLLRKHSSLGAKKGRIWG